MWGMKDKNPSMHHVTNILDRPATMKDQREALWVNMNCPNLIGGYKDISQLPC